MIIVDVVQPRDAHGPTRNSHLHFLGELCCSWPTLWAVGSRHQANRRLVDFHFQTFRSTVLLQWPLSPCSTNSFSGVWESLTIRSGKWIMVFQSGGYIKVRFYAYDASSLCRYSVYGTYVFMYVYFSTSISAYFFLKRMKAIVKNIPINVRIICW